MRKSELEKNISFVVYGDDAWRVRVEQGSKPLIKYDAHGQTVGETRKALHNIIAATRDGVNLCVIHGYNGGTAIRDMLTAETISDRITDKHCYEYNPGRTWMSVACAY